MKKFIARYGQNTIDEYEVVAETEKQITYINENGKEKRCNKNTNYDSWHDTKEDAKNCLIKSQEMQILWHNRMISNRNESIAKIKEL